MKWNPEPIQFFPRQNTIRDARVVGIHLNEFNKRCDCSRMANIAQTVNVLQSLIFTKQEKMVLAPTYHVFEMYKLHNDAILFPTDIEYVNYALDEKELPSLHISLCSIDPDHSAQIHCELHGFKVQKVIGRVLTAFSINSYNTFENPDVVHPEIFNDNKLNGSMIITTLLSKSVVVLGIE